MYMENTINKSKTVFDNMMYYRICETLFIKMKKQTKYNTFSSMCSNLRDSVANELVVSGELSKVMSGTIFTIVKLYGIKYNESLRYIRAFLSNNMWIKYQPLVNTFYTKTQNSFQ